MIVADILFSAALVFMLACSLYLAPRIARGRIDMQWSFDGRPVWSVPKAFGLWMMIGFALATRGLVWALMAYAPDSVHGAELGVMIVAVTMAISHLVILLRAAERPPD